MDCRVIIFPLDWIVKCTAISDFVVGFVRFADWVAIESKRIVGGFRRIRTLVSKSIAGPLSS